MRYLLLSCIVLGLSYRCDYELFGEVSNTHFLYKEDNLDQVKWLEKVEYCRAKGDPSVYNEAGQGKCEYSRGLCYWDSGECLNTYRDSDSYQDCVDLWFSNELVEGLDNGRLQFQPVLPSPVQDFQPVLPSPTQDFQPVLPSPTQDFQPVLLSPVQDFQPEEPCINEELCYYMYVAVI